MPTRPSSSFKQTGIIARLATLAATGLLFASSPVSAQESDEVIWHNRYHALLAMAAYGDWRTLCPQQTFTPEGLQANFPGSTADSFTVLETFGPTAHGAEGFTAYIPETNKVTLVFKGDYNLEKNLPVETESLDAFNLGDRCIGCRANAFALAGYLEALEETNGFSASIARFREIEEATNDFYFSVTGHGLGGMHSILATVHLGAQGIVTFSHNYGSPRTLNPAAAAFHNFILGGNQLDRGGANADIFMHQIPQSDEYTHANTGIWYHGVNETFHMNSEFCYEEPEAERCLPSGNLNEEDHYFYFVNVGQCGGRSRLDMDIIAPFLAQERAKTYDPNASRTMPAALTTGIAPVVSNVTSSTSTGLPEDLAINATAISTLNPARSTATSSGPRVSSTGSGGGAFGANNAAAASGATGVPDNNSGASANAGMVAGSVVLCFAALAVSLAMC